MIALRLVPPAPPPPHDPGERIRVAWAGNWEVRQFAPDDPKLEYFRSRGFLHLQLWHPGEWISILTRSRLTAGHFEMWRPGPVRGPATSWSAVVARLGGVRAPSATEVFALESWFIERQEPASLRLLRRWWRGRDGRAAAGPPAPPARPAPASDRLRDDRR